MSARVTWEGGGEAELVALEGDHVTLRSSRAFPPGAPARGRVEGAEALPIAVKVAGSRRGDDGSFTVRGRIVSPTVALRAALRGDAA